MRRKRALQRQSGRKLGVDAVGPQWTLNCLAMLRCNIAKMAAQACYLDLSTPFWFKATHGLSDLVNDVRGDVLVDGLEGFKAEVNCAYRGEYYRVRDNGSVFRCARQGRRKRPLDETWVFGNPSKSDGYMAISSHKLHRIVAIAFHGEQPSNSHVVDNCFINRQILNRHR